MDLGPHVTTMAYADDFVVLVSGPNTHKISRRANIALAKIAEWAELHKLQFSAAKTSAVLFRKPHDGDRRRTPRTFPRIRFLGTAVKAVKTQQYLSYTIDDNLNGLAHVANIRTKMAKYVLAVNSLSRRDWGLSGVVLKLLYKRGLERIATYACGSWWTDSAVMRDQLNSAQRLALVAITRCFRTTSTVALQVLAGCLPLDLQVELEYNMTTRPREH